MKTQKQFFGRASALLVLLALAALLAACTADTVNINGTYKYTDSNITELRLSRADSNNVNGTVYAGSSEQNLQKTADISGKLEGYEPIKLNFTYRGIDGKVISDSADVLDYGNKLKFGDREFIKQK